MCSMIEHMFDERKDPRHVGHGQDPWQVEPGDERQEILADLRRRITSVATRGDMIGRPLRSDLDIPRPVAPEPVRRAVAVPTSSRTPAGHTPTAAPVVRVRHSTTVLDSTVLDPMTVLDPSRTSILAVPPPLAAVLPRGGLPKGSVVSLAGGHGVTSLLFSLLAAPENVWSALVGLPEAGLLAAAEFGVDLNRLVLIPEPGPDVLQVLSVLTDGVELIAVAPPRDGFVAPARLRVLTGRLRQRGAILLVMGGWPGADLVLRTRLGSWSGIGQGHGRLRDRELTVEVGGRGAAGRHRSVTMLLQSSRTHVQVSPTTLIPVVLPMVPADSPLTAEVG